METHIEKIGLKIYREIANNFPIASASDEFFYFPQVMAPAKDWSVWDRFSSEFITTFAGRLSLWETEIDQLILKTPIDTIADYAQIKLLKKVTRTLREQLILIRLWEIQPSFYLAIVSIGLAEALKQGVGPAIQRAKTLPRFLDQAGENLKIAPDCFRELGLEMIRDVRAYLIMLKEKVSVLSDGLDALNRFEERLMSVSSQSGFRMTPEKLALVVEDHINCGMPISEVNEILHDEIEAMKRVLAEMAKAMEHDTWQGAYASIAPPKVREDGLVGLYRDEVLSLGRHCGETGLVSGRLYDANPVKVMPVPGYLSAIRAASSYSIAPGHPPCGGVFYVINAHDPREFKKAYNREYRILSAHETWPGHHLLDINRWSLPSPILRPVEQPVLYEGWACFAEEILAMTGYLTEPSDRLILAKRRLWRAIRGKVDLGLQTGAMSLEKATALLTQTGMSEPRARSSARKYLLNPGYQLCYTLGLRNFLDLYDRYGNNNIKTFSRIVLNQGEICFDDLEKILQKNGVNP